MPMPVLAEYTELGDEDRALVEPPKQDSDDDGDIEDGEYWGELIEEDIKNDVPTSESESQNISSSVHEYDHSRLSWFLEQSDHLEADQLETGFRIARLLSMSSHCHAKYLETM